MEYAMIPIVMSSSSASSIVRYAGFWKRFAASCIDGLVVFTGPLILATIITMIVGAGLDGEARKEAVEPVGIGFTIVFLSLWLLYPVFMESSSKRATLGKIAVGLIVTDLNGNRISLARAFGRHFAKLISSMTFGIGYIMAGFTGQRQALHDRIAGTLVLLLVPNDSNVDPKIAATNDL
jgi:uncharacterized RDD family membrane protein YckC